MPERIDRGPQRGERILHGRKFVQVDAAAHVDRNVAREQGIHVRMRASEMPRYDRDLPGRRSAREQPLYPLHDEARFVAIVLGAIHGNGVARRRASRGVAEIGAQRIQAQQRDPFDRGATAATHGERDRRGGRLEIFGAARTGCESTRGLCRVACQRHSVETFAIDRREKSNLRPGKILRVVDRRARIAAPQRVAEIRSRAQQERRFEHGIAGGDDVPFGERCDVRFIETRQNEHEIDFAGTLPLEFGGRDAQRIAMFRGRVPQQIGMRQIRRTPIEFDRAAQTFRLERLGRDERRAQFLGGA